MARALPHGAVQAELGQVSVRRTRAAAWRARRHLARASRSGALPKVRVVAPRSDRSTSAAVRCGVLAVLGGCGQPDGGQGGAVAPAPSARVRCIFDRRQPLAVL